MCCTVYNLSRAVTASNTVDFPTNVNNGFSSAITAAGAGNIAAVFEDNSVAVIAMAAGQLLPVRIKRINSTSTTATGLTVHYAI